MTTPSEDPNETAGQSVISMHEQMKATVVYGDVLGCIRNYFYDGWKYRVGPKMENYDEVNKESYQAARNMMDEFFKVLGSQGQVIDLLKLYPDANTKVNSKAQSSAQGKE